MAPLLSIYLHTLATAAPAEAAQDPFRFPLCLLNIYHHYYYYHYLLCVSVGWWYVVLAQLPTCCGTYFFFVEAPQSLSYEFHKPRQTVGPRFLVFYEPCARFTTV